MNNKMVSFDYIINICFKKNDVYIPLIQRNYKWDADTAAKLAVDLWRAYLNRQETYTVGMITFYRESDDKMQLIDGQQRIITLYILLKYLEPDKEYYSFQFERDEGIEESQYKRQSYLKNINSPGLSVDEMYTDLFRFTNNYKKIAEMLIIFRDDMEDESGKYNAYDHKYASDFSEYIRKSIYFLLHISDTEPFDEFINLNKNKTRFVISDRIKANLMIDSKEKTKKEEVRCLFRELAEMLFLKHDVWELVKQGYWEENLSEDYKRHKNRLYPDENRLKLICCERYGGDEYDGNSTLGYQYDNELTVLKCYRDILAILTEDIVSCNWNSYNAFNCLYKLQDKKQDQEALRFFKILKNIEYKYLENYLIEYIKRKEEPFSLACFIESQLCYEKSKLEYIDALTDIREEFNKKRQENWLYNGIDEFEIFCRLYSDYIKDKYSN